MTKINNNVEINEEEILKKFINSGSIKPLFGNKDDSGKKIDDNSNKDSKQEELSIFDNNYFDNNRKSDIENIENNKDNKEEQDSINFEDALIDDEEKEELDFSYFDQFIDNENSDKDDEDLPKGVY